MFTKSTVSVKNPEVKRDWYLIDATDLVDGRLASVVAFYLMGKHKPIYTPHVDCGDYIVIINAEKVALTGARKPLQLKYFHHTMFPGGIKEIDAKSVLLGKHPERVIEKAVERMMPKTKLGREMIKKLFVYSGANHKHSAQNPIALDVAKMNSKNKRGA
ncbi:MAG: 50S ribosomal protein L13 [Rickettsiales bacterium]|jgi:large subunit ribosomal protein L13|nr:50S ribosomal protein L13 [Rickettsiales bacterium]